MNGQWIGEYSGTNQGLIFVNVDDILGGYDFTAYLHDSSNQLPDSGVNFLTKNKNRNFSLSIPVYPINPNTGIFDEWSNVKNLFHSSVRAPSQADVNVTFDGINLKLSWVTDIQSSGSCLLKKSKVDDESSLNSKQFTWEEFKEYILSLDGREYIYRGQKSPWKLSTSYHRLGRANLRRYLEFDIPALHKYLSSQTNHFFNLNKSEENGAFYNLVQHHGYPTPLLDWTSSPYVAAFFAYREVNKNCEASILKNEKVRIFMFDRFEWVKDFPQIGQLLLASPHFSIREFLAIENNRMIPQQAVSSLTNLVDIEAYIQQKERDTGKKYLYSFDLPAFERAKVIKELQLMGVTAGTLFPGLDGTCEELKERNF